ncbi:alpha/beta hydrolase [Chryseobacterium sp.]|uniref:alpha/beta hydrolase n=1 Tax=Chryseobacterium sp. TaxID=1871047 RepID=UPI0025BF4CFC|nr:alpha/beta hydrolase [Chryseobacterium sp.]
MKILNNNQSSFQRFLFNLFFISLVFGSFHQGFSQSKIPEQPKIEKSILLTEKTLISESITYKTDENGNSILLDIYHPKNTFGRNLPIAIYVHGGAWVLGDKTIRKGSYIEDLILKLVEKEYIVISINYRLVNEHTHFPSPIQDCKDAVRWVRKNAEKYHFDTANIGLIGTSAGAHLSLLTAYTSDNDFIGSPELASYSAKVNYVVDNYGPADLNKLMRTRLGKVQTAIAGLFLKELLERRSDLLLGLTGYDIEKDKKKIIEICQSVSPLAYVKNAVPTQILQGNKDKIVPLKQSKKLYKTLKKNNIETSLTIVDQGTHGFKTTDTDHLHEIVNEMVTFIISHTSLTTSAEKL